MTSEGWKRYEGKSLLERLEVARNYSGFITSLTTLNVKTSSRVLDFGAGRGSYAAEMMKRCREVVCVEPDQELCEEIRNSLHIICEPSVSTLVGRFNFVYSINVLEHVEDDLETMRQVFEVLEPGGEFFVYLPASPRLFSKFDESIGHFRRYRRNELKSKLRTTGFIVTECSYADPLGWVLGFIHKHTLRGRTPSVISLKIFDRILFPMSAWLSKYTSNWFGKNVHARAYRPPPTTPSKEEAR